MSEPIWRSENFLQENRRIFEEELDGFLPDRVFDTHVHVFPAEVLPPGEQYDCAGHKIGKYDIEDLEQDVAEALPGREFHSVLFGSPNPDYDNAANNRYVARAGGGGRFIPFRLLDPGTDTAESLRSDIKAQGFRGLKPYLRFVRKDNPETVEVPDMLPEWAMEAADNLGLALTLHIPRRDRLADSLNRKQVADYSQRYPNARIVLAHIGRAYFLRNVVGNLDELASLPNVYFDLAMLNNWEVLEYTFRTVPAEKLLFGTDIPIALAPGKSVEINDQYTYVTPAPWKLSISDDHHKLVFTSFLYEELRAIKKAVERLGLGRDFVNGLFYGNAAALFDLQS